MWPGKDLEGGERYGGAWLRCEQCVQSKAKLTYEPRSFPRSLQNLGNLEGRNWPQAGDRPRRLQRLCASFLQMTSINPDDVLFRENQYRDNQQSMAIYLLIKCVFQLQVLKGR